MDSVKNLFRTSLLISVLFVLAFCCKASSTGSTKPDTLFLSDEVLNLEIRADFSAIQVNRVDSPEYHDGLLIYYSPDGKNTKFTIKLMCRGNFRRKPENCDFPPLLINFKKGEVENTIFENQDKLKLVTPCKDEDVVFSEYIVYKMYNEVTDISLNVRLARISYFDTGTNKELFVKHSFFIEDADRLAMRIGDSEENKKRWPYELDEEQFMKIPFFQYMVGQEDWVITTRHNVFFIQPNDTAKGSYIIPYDYDFAGLVNADYSKPKGVPDEFLPNRRVYRGLCYSYAELEEIFAFYKELQPVFNSIINDFSFISKSNRRRMINYIDYFYQVIESEELINQEFMGPCLTRKDYGYPEK